MPTVTHPISTLTNKMIKMNVGMAKTSGIIGMFGRKYLSLHFKSQKATSCQNIF